MQNALMFTVIIPTWQGHRCWELLRDTQHTTEHVDLDPGQHGFCEGAQHNRAIQFRAASTGTSVFFLQTPAARSKWAVTASNVARLLEAFRPKSSSFTGVSGVPGDDAATGVVTAGRDALMQGDFSKGVAPRASKGVGRQRRGRAAQVAHPSQDPSAEGQAPVAAELVEPGSATRNNEEGPAGSTASGTKKRKRCHVASSTGKFAPEGSAVAVTERLLAADAVGMPCPHHEASGGAAEQQVVAEGSHSGISPAAEAHGVVAFPMSKSQRQKANRAQSARRKSAKRQRK